MYYRCGIPIIRNKDRGDFVTLDVFRKVYQIVISAVFS